MLRPGYQVVHLTRDAASFLLQLVSRLVYCSLERLAAGVESHGLVLSGAEGLGAPSGFDQGCVPCLNVLSPGQHCLEVVQPFLCCGDLRVQFGQLTLSLGQPRGQLLHLSLLKLQSSALLVQGA